MYNGPPANERVSVEGHTGCRVLGNTFPIVHGSGDGERLVAHIIFVARCDQEWEHSDIFETPVGRIVERQWTVELSVSH